jgi:hypothetical protein
LLARIVATFSIAVEIWPTVIEARAVVPVAAVITPTPVAVLERSRAPMATVVPPSSVTATLPIEEEPNKLTPLNFSFELSVSCCLRARNSVL